MSYADEIFRRNAVDEITAPAWREAERLEGECDRLRSELFVAAEGLAQAGDALNDRTFLAKSERARIAAGGHDHSAALTKTEAPEGER